MPIVYPDILQLENKGQPFEWTQKDTMLYALGIGMGTDPLDRNELRYVYERDLQAMPTLASVVASGSRPGNLGIDPVMVVDGERAITFHQPMPVAAKITADSRILGAWDKGVGKGAVIAIETVLTLAQSETQGGAKLATIVASMFARGDGGFGGPSSGQPEPHSVPTRAPDRSLDIPTTASQALLYRLSGDYHPLHSDPDFAARAGFPRPILHGLCTYGITCRAVLQNYADYDASKITSHAARFSSPVFPGETITVDLWKDGNVVSFEARVKNRDVTVIKNGKTVLA